MAIPQSIEKVVAQYGSHLAHYQAARKELAACNEVDEVLAIADKSVAIRAYAAQVADKELENLAIRIRLRAERRCVRTDG